MAKYDKADKSESKLDRANSERAERGKLPSSYDVGASRESAVSRDPAKESALSRAVQQIEKQFGKGSVMKLDGNARASVDGIPTGSLSLDIALGGSRVPRGRGVE